MHIITASVTVSLIKIQLFNDLKEGFVKDNVIHNMAWWLKSAGALNFALSQEQCPISL